MRKLPHTSIKQLFHVYIFIGFWSHGIRYKVLVGHWYNLPRKFYSSFHFVLSCICLFSLGCNMNSDPSTENEKKLITEISKARAKAFNEGNAAAIALHFTEEALLMAPDKPAAQGRAAVQAYYQSIFDEYTTQLESHYEEVEVSGNLAYGRGHAKVTLIPKKGGTPEVSTAKYLNILKKQPDGLWKTTHDIWNDNE